MVDATKNNNCKICSYPIKHFSNAKILKKYEIEYFKCGECGLIQTEESYWLEESYSEAIMQNDVGIVNRNIALSKITKTIIPIFFDKKSKYLDYGGGYGLLVRMMRDCGFDFYWFDKYCQNIFAKGFEAEEGCKYELLTAFEIFEHLADPVAELGEMLKFSRNILFTTELVPAGDPKPTEWWYYVLEHGQHISFYKKITLKALADKYQLKLYSDGKSIHLLTEKTLSETTFRVITKNYVIRKFLNILFKSNSLIEQDYLKSIESDK